MFTTLGLMEAVKTCKAHQEWQHGSDHIPVYTVLDLTVEEPVAILHRACKTPKPEEVGKAIAELAGTLGYENLLTKEAIEGYLGKLMKRPRKVVVVYRAWRLFGPVQAD